MKARIAAKIEPEVQPQHVADRIVEADPDPARRVVVVRVELRRVVPHDSPVNECHERETDVDLNELESGTPQTIAWPEPHSDRPPIVVQRLERTSPSENNEKSENSGRGEAEKHPDSNDQGPESIGRGWWVFEWRGLAVSRWIPANEKSASEKAAKE